MENPIDLTKLNDNAIKRIIRSRYYGGRTESFYLSVKEPTDLIYYFDFNRIYPNITVKYNMPTGSPIVIKDAHLDSLINNIEEMKVLNKY